MHPIVAEELEAARVNTSQRQKRWVPIRRVDQLGGSGVGQVSLSFLERGRAAGNPVHVLDIGESFKAQQLLRKVPRRHTDGSITNEADLLDARAAARPPPCAGSP